MPDKKPESRELKPGKQLIIAGKTYRGNKITKFVDKSGKEKTEIIQSKTCMVPELEIETYGMSDQLIEKTFVKVPGKK